MTGILLLAALSTAPCILWTALPDEDIVSVASPGDVNGNGTADVVAAAGCGVGGLWCVDGRTGAVLWSADLPGVHHGEGLCAVSDLDGDLVGDVVLGAGDGPPPSQGRVQAVSGADGQVLWDSPNDPCGTVWAVASSPGPPGEIPVIHASAWVDVWVTFLTLDGADGDTLWSITHATFDPWIRTMADLDGNGWGEIGYSVDRSSYSGGFCRIHDGCNGGPLFILDSWYFGRMDLCDSPAPLIAVGQWGNMTEDLRLVTVPGGTTLYGLDEAQVLYQSIRFVRDVVGGTLPSPVLAGWEGSALNLVCGTWGEVSDVYEYDAGIVDLAGCQTSPQDWVLVVLTGSSLYLTEPSLCGGSPGESCPLPASGGDLCLLTSDQYPSPLAAVGLQGPGPGLCAIVTSWPEGIAGEETPQVDPGVHLLRNPGRGGIRLAGEESMRVIVLDIVGREAAEVVLPGRDEAFVPLPPGIYLAVDGWNGNLLFRVVVIGGEEP